MTSPTAEAAPAADTQATSTLIGRQRRNVIFVAIALAMLVASMAGPIVSAAQPTIVDDLGGAEHESWLVTSNVLGATIVVALAGKLGDLFGRKRLFLAAVVLFAIASLLCALSHSMLMLVVSRALQGIGGGGIAVTASALVAEVVPLRSRGYYQGILGAVAGFGMVTAPLVGGYLSDYLTWRWAFWINVPVGVVVVLMTATTLPALAARPKPVIDYPGILLLFLGAAGLTLATSWGGTTYAWDSPTIIGLLVGFAVALGIFVSVERRVREPVLPTTLFRSPTFTVCCLLAFVVGVTLLCALVFLPTYLRYVSGLSATASGLRTLPMVAGIMLGSTGSGILASRTGRYKVFPVAGMALIAAGYLLLSFMDASTPTALQSLYFAMLGVGIGLSMQLLVVIVQNMSSFGHLGVATSAVTFFRFVGYLCGAAILGTIFANFLDRRIGLLKVSEALAEAASSPTTLHQLPHDVAAPIVRAYADSLSEVFLCSAVLATAGFILALFLREAPMTDIHDGAGDLGDGFGMPNTESPDDLLEIRIARMLRNSSPVQVETMAAQPDCELDTARLWGVLQIYQCARLFGTARGTDIAKALHVPSAVLQPTFDRLIQTGYALRDGDELQLTQSGGRQVDFVITSILEWIIGQLDRSPGFQDRPDRHEVEAALKRVAPAVLFQGAPR
jgi:EmrB/QacA subfamily drug resistance transporter